MPNSVALLLAIIAVAVISRIRWPWARCWSCKGTGRNGGSTSRRWGVCGRCGGSGKRRRFGARKE